MKQSNAVADDGTLPIVPTPKPKSFIKKVKKKIKRVLNKKEQEMD